MKRGPTSKRYSEAFKRQIVRDIEGGVVTPWDVRSKYGVSGGATVRGWLRRYGTGKVAGRASRSKRVVESRKMLMLERRSRELEQAVARLTVEKVALEALIEEAQSEFGIEFKKTFGQGR